MRSVLFSLSVQSLTYHHFGFTPLQTLIYCLKRIFLLFLEMEHDNRVPLPESSGLSKTIESVTDAKPMSEFTCELCQITAPYEHYSHESPKGASKKIKFHEKCYSLLDPFRPPRQRLVLVVGAACSGKC